VWSERREPMSSAVPSQKPSPPTSRRKRDIRRPYAPSYVTREEIAYRVQVSVSTVEAWIRQHLLPPQIMVFTVARWRWSDIEEAIETQNLLAGANDLGAPSQHGDEFLDGVQRVASSRG
jgi:predicted DNA-binding transcriptional regulator AlpA